MNSGLSFSVRAVTAVWHRAVEQPHSADFEADCRAPQLPESDQVPVAELAAFAGEAQRAAGAERPERVVAVFGPGP